MHLGSKHYRFGSCSQLSVFSSSVLLPGCLMYVNHGCSCMYDMPMSFLLLPSSAQVLCCRLDGPYGIWASLRCSLPALMGWLEREVFHPRGVYLFYYSLHSIWRSMFLQGEGPSPLNTCKMPNLFIHGHLERYVLMYLPWKQALLCATEHMRV